MTTSAFRASETSSEDFLSPSTPNLSIVIPVHNESGNIGPLLDEIMQVLLKRVQFEIVCVDDASTDATLSKLREIAQRHPELVVLSHVQQAGQSLAIRNGVKAARAAWVATLDGDGQNDPGDLLQLMEALRCASTTTKLVGGWRVDRKDHWSKRGASRLANSLRSRLLRDSTPDTGFGIKLFEREAFLDLPYFDHMHRYLAALMQRAGWQTISVPVNHRARASGISKYNNLGRLWVGVSDLCGVAWLVRRSSVVSIRADSPVPQPDARLPSRE